MNKRSRADKASGWVAERHAFESRYFFNIFCYFLKFAFKNKLK